jgi:pimeloyl-ACP methyl ester carboxylesterase
MLLLHGFPEFWFSWRYQLKEFSKDYHVVAIDMRGYGDTDHPEGKMSYTLDKLGQDIIQLIPALGYSSCVLVAHDWGGAVAWYVADTAPELINKLIILNAPHISIMGEEITSTWRQWLKSWYIFMFQVPWLPEFIIGLNDYRNFNAIFRGQKAGVKNKASFPPDVVEAYKYTFSKPGALTGPINYIRAIYNTRHFIFSKVKKMINVPTLLLWGDCDLFLGRGMADRHSSLCTNLVVKHIPNCSHWVQQDVPDLCNQYISDFLSRDTASEVTAE